MKILNRILFPITCILFGSQEVSFPAAMTYSNYAGLYFASQKLPGEQVNISFNGYPNSTQLVPGVVISNISFFGEALITQVIPGAPYTYLNNYDSVTFFGLIPATTMYQITISDGGALLGMHEELIAEILAVINKPPTLDLASSSTNQLNIGVNGAAGQTLVLLSSTNLANWQPVMTNKLASDRWVYSDTKTNSTSPRFYRVAAQ